MLTIKYLIYDNVLLIVLIKKKHILRCLQFTKVKFMRALKFVPRYIYGRVKEFKNASFGAEVYKFAHEMQIDSLTEDLGKFFEGTKAPEMFSIFDLLLRLDGNQTALETCKQVII